MDNTAMLMTVNQETMMPTLTVELAISRYKQINSFIGQVLRQGTDYGKVPSTDKDTLLKPGAEKLCMFFGYHPTFQNVTVIEDWTGEKFGGEPFFYYLTRCRLIKNGEVMAEADGSCNSRESKYRYRQSERVCPTCGKPAIKRSKFPPKGKPNETPGWYCYDKAGGCGANFAHNDRAITEQQTGRVPNPDIADQANTILKMAQKRALIAATLIGVNASDYFTQDVEDLPGFGDVVDGHYTVIEQPQPQPAPVAVPANGNGHSEPPPMSEADAEFHAMTSASQERAQSQPAEGTPKPSIVGTAVTMTRPFAVAHPRWLDKHGNPDIDHIRLSLGKLGFTTRIDGTNAQDAFAKLNEYALSKEADEAIASVKQPQLAVGK